MMFIPKQPVTRICWRCVASSLCSLELREKWVRIPQYIIVAKKVCGGLSPFRVAPQMAGGEKLANTEGDYMGRLVRGKRDGTGPYKGSYRRSKYGIGKRRASGKKCPKRRGR